MQGAAEAALPRWTPLWRAAPSPHLPARSLAPSATPAALVCRPHPIPQTRLILPAWLGVADALLAAAEGGKRAMLRDMYQVCSCVLVNTHSVRVGCC